MHMPRARINWISLAITLPWITTQCGTDFQKRVMWIFILLNCAHYNKSIKSKHIRDNVLIYVLRSQFSILKKWYFSWRKGKPAEKETSRKWKYENKVWDVSKKPKLLWVLPEFYSGSNSRPQSHYMWDEGDMDVAQITRRAPQSTAGSEAQRGLFP